MAPSGDAVRGGATELGGIETKANALGLGEQRALKAGDMLVGIANARGVHPLTRQKCGVKRPIAQGLDGLRAHERRLAVEKHATEHVELVPASRKTVPVRGICATAHSAMRAFAGRARPERSVTEANELL